jgi:hypothetical protein
MATYFKFHLYAFLEKATLQCRKEISGWQSMERERLRTERYGIGEFEKMMDKNSILIWIAINQLSKLIELWGHICSSSSRDWDWPRQHSKTFFSGGNKSLRLGVVLHTCNASTQKAEAGRSWIEVSLAYLAISRLVWATWQDPLRKPGLRI